MSAFPALLRHGAALLPLCATLVTAPAHAGPVDQRAPEHAAPFWQHAGPVANGTVLAGLGGALWLGTDDRLGQALWQGVESAALAGVATEVVKRAAGRLRPTETSDPNRWFEGGRSFPSGHVAQTTAMVTPLILEYRRDQPLVWLLAVLPAYEMTSRVRLGPTGNPMSWPAWRWAWPPAMFLTSTGPSSCAPCPAGFSSGSRVCSNRWFCFRAPVPVDAANDNGYHLHLTHPRKRRCPRRLRTFPAPAERFGSRICTSGIGSVRRCACSACCCSA